MTIALFRTMTRQRRSAATTAVVMAVALLGMEATPAIAQAGPPVAKAPRDSQPAIKQLKAPSAPPSSVAPRPGSSARVAFSAPADSGPRPLKRMSAPVDSARPAISPPQPLDARRAPPERITPPAPSASKSVQPAAVRASFVSDEPPLGATARCKDGTYLTSVVDTNSCSDRGGLAVRLPAPRTAPKRPTP